MEQPLIQIRELSKVYSTPEGEVVALDRVSLDVRKGEIYGVIGMSGAGKSTLIRCINRLDVPTGGEVLYRGQDVLKMSRPDLLKLRRKVSMIFQQFNLLMQRTVGENVRYPLEIAGLPRREADKRVMELLEIVGLQDRAKAYPAQLSGGQRQRVAIARALASQPEVLLSDEATSALDPMTTQAILNLLKDINRRLGITVILITHEMAVIRQICDRVTILDGGRIAEEGTVDEVFMHTKSEAGRRLFGNAPQVPEEEPQGPAIRLVFDGSSVDRPIIATAVKELGIMINILSADMKQIGGKTYGQMLIRMPDDEETSRKLADFLTQENIAFKEVNIK
ncbi:MAG: ATP-binding cassette domain-containing protein [Clostridiales bacterium]|nr:ATP-binding cassette domain-containing protein [Clostridia bacterium]NLD02946.1 ATP-binding cassette domain-containing protein [Clostridiales bacterium]